MSITQNIRLCTHIKVNGTRCGSPALREEVFCYFHQRMIRSVRTPAKSRIHPIAMLEDKESIQASLMEIINALVRNHIDVSRARVILRALYIAARNSGKTSFEPFYRNVVTEVPDYPAAPGPFALAVEQAEALAYVNTPQEEESEAERLQSSFAAMAAPPPQRKQAARAKTDRARKTARPRSPAPVAERANGSQSRAYQ